MEFLVRFKNKKVLNQVQESEENKIIEVYYAGSRENAPY